jgi:hypothetical protein
MVETAGTKRRSRLVVIRFALLTCAALGAGDALAAAYHVVGQCRSGTPNGAYELRLSDGRLRVVGAFSQGRMTGTFIFWAAGGARIAVVPLDNDLRNGTIALWYTGPGGRTEAGHKLEAPYVDGQPHGVKRAWYADGTPRTKARYEHGELIEAQAWSARGKPLTESEARVLVAQDAGADERTYESLLALVHNHLPICEAATAGHSISGSDGPQG